MILNADEYDVETFLAMFGAISHGWGESFWIRDGRVVYFHKGVKEDGPVRVIREKITEMGAW
jgi:hypothetical protein